MKVRTGFVTNSSSTNFLIISKNELNAEYLFDKLGFVRGGALEHQGMQLCNDIMRAIEDGYLYHCDVSEIDRESIEEYFGPKSAYIFDTRKDWHAYWGRTSTDDNDIFNEMTIIFTTSCFEIEDDDFYLNGKDCVW